jgi:hypothetical protein
VTIPTRPGFPVESKRESKVEREKGGCCCLNKEKEEEPPSITLIHPLVLLSNFQWLLVRNSVMIKETLTSSASEERGQKKGAGEGY